jgi:hypothetical protein
VLLVLTFCLFRLPSASCCYLLSPALQHAYFHHTFSPRTSICKLQHTHTGSAHDKKIGCNAVGHLLFQCGKSKVATLCKALSSSGAIGKILKLLYELDLGVAAAAAKSLRNFSLVGEALPTSLKQILTFDEPFLSAQP